MCTNRLGRVSPGKGVPEFVPIFKQGCKYNYYRTAQSWYNDRETAALFYYSVV